MSMLDTTCIPKSVTGQTQLLEIALTMAGLEDAANPFSATDAQRVDKFVQCSEHAVKYFSVRF